ncbi:MAG: glycosyltransferase family 2 protein [Spongiibacteraceae bacterium]|jgi:glycosyltransferase involved in cell wall biosynthesis|nr:glycosyltransferase family 2 protein [Spongiibacteraceae bacterium]
MPSSTGLPLVSIALCTYNGERYLAEQLESLLHQTHTNLDIRVFDDGSSDGTLAVLQTYAARDPRIAIHTNVENLGYIRNFELALQACPGEFIAMCDQDDIWHPEKIETLLAEIGDKLLIYSEVELMDQHGTPTSGRFPQVTRLEGHCALSLLLDNCVTGHACLLRRDLLAQALPFPEGIIAHDQWLAIVAAAQGGLKASGHVLSRYRQHAQNALLNKRKREGQSRAARKTARDARLARLALAMKESGFFEGEDRELLEELATQLSRNTTLFYNYRLHGFLSAHSEKFLALYTEPKKQIKKLCRGAWFYRLFPFG